MFKSMYLVNDILIEMFLKFGHRDLKSYTCTFNIVMGYCRMSLHPVCRFKKETIMLNVRNSPPAVGICFPGG